RQTNKQTNKRTKSKGVRKKFTGGKKLKLALVLDSSRAEACTAASASKSTPHSPLNICCFDTSLQNQDLRCCNKVVLLNTSLSSQLVCQVQRHGMAGILY
ncbi:hypothetical protein THAOC_13334, partial [Thalassiosira oceanica]